jgi:hypothetical protein
MTDGKIYGLSHGMFSEHVRVTCKASLIEFGRRVIGAALSKQEAATPAIPTLQECGIKYAEKAGYRTDEANFHRVFYAYCAGFTDGTKAAQPVPNSWIAPECIAAGTCIADKQCPGCGSGTPAPQEPAEPVARVLRDGATVRLEWASVEAAHNAKPGPLYTQSVANAPQEPAEPVVPGRNYDSR